MRQNVLLHILMMLGILAVSCKDAAIEYTPDFSEESGRKLSLMVDIPEMRTRAVDLTPGASLYLKNIWVGVYDKATGNRVGGTLNDTVELDRYLTASGSTLIDLVSIDILPDITATENDKYCVVGVANYDGIKVVNRADDADDDFLYSQLKAADEWSDFIQIAIDTQNSKFENQVPLLIGYLGKEKVNPQQGVSSYTKVDQFKGDPGVNLYGYENEGDVFVGPRTTNGKLTGIKTKDDNENKNYILKLRRMRSKINISINTASGITVTNMQYKMCNVPKSAFLVQRCTNSFASEMGDGREFSPNSADVLYDDNTKGYYETEYEFPQINTNFSFEHFENKHWARYPEELEEYHDREKHDGSGVFSALAANAEDWNNMASYFVLKMNIRDDNIGRNAEIEYMIHEGFCNDEDGNSLTGDDGDGPLEQRLLDFACVRNTDYYYNIQINSIEYIELQVTDSERHTNDQRGKVWDIHYVNVQNKNDERYVVSPTKTEINSPLKLKESGDIGFVNSKDIAFRFLGSYYDTEKAVEVPVDICYNFNRGALDGFAGIWNAPTNESTEYIVATTSQNDDPISAYESLEAFCSSGSDNAIRFNHIIDDIKVKYSEDYLNIKDYLEIVTKDSEKDPNIDGFQFEGLKYYEAFDGNNDNLRDHIRGLYIFDTQKAFSDGTRVRRDNDQCTDLYIINGIEQVPEYLKQEQYEMVFVTGNSDERIGPKGSSNDLTNFRDGHNGEGMLLSEHPDFAFRLLGYDGDPEKYYDILYNFTQSEYTELTEWPQMNLNGIYSSEIAKGALGAKTIPDSFLEGLTILVNGGTALGGAEYNIYDFVTAYEGKTLRLTKNDKLGFRVGEYDKEVRTYPENKDNYMNKYRRALYLFDKKNKFVKPALYDSGTNSATFQVYAVEQNPGYRATTKLELPYIDKTYKDNITYNIIDAALLSREIPAIQGIDASVYRYKLVTMTEDGSEAESYVNVDPVNGNYTWAVPMHRVAGKKGIIKLMAESVNGDYDSSDWLQIGAYELQEPPVWQSGDGDWQIALDNLTTDKGKKINDVNEFDYLSFGDGEFQKTNDGAIRMNNNPSTISFKIYKACTIKFKAYANGHFTNGVLDFYGQMKVTAGDYTFETGDLKTTAASAEDYTFTISDEYFTNDEGLTVTFARGTGTGTFISFIQVIAL